MQGQSDSEAISALFISYEESWFKTNFTLSFGEKKGTSGGGRCDQRWLWDVVEFHYENIILKYYFV